MSATRPTSTTPSAADGRPRVASPNAPPRGVPPACPPPPRWPLRAAAIASAGLVILVAVQPRAATAGLLVALAVALLVGGRRTLARLRPSGASNLPTLALAVSAFIAWSLLSAAWSAAPMASATKPLYLLAATVGLVLIADLARRTEASLLTAVLSGALAGAAVGGLLQVIEMTSGQALTRWAMTLFPDLRAGQDKHVRMIDGVVTAVSQTNINRRAALITLLLCPAGLIAVVLLGGWRRTVALAAVATVAVGLLAVSAHQSSQLAIVMGGLVLGLALLSVRWTSRLMAAGWVAAVLLAVPLAFGLAATGWQTADSGLFQSARHRILIWRHTAEEILKAPVFGVGADATPASAVGRQEETEEFDGRALPKGARHAHNVYLQVWYELGAIGALIFAGLGLAAIAAVRAAPLSLQPLLLAHLAVVAGMIASSYGLWQLWLQATFGLGLVAITTAIAHHTRSATPRDA